MGGRRPVRTASRNRDLHDDRLGVVDGEGLDVDELVPLEPGEVVAGADLFADLAHLELVGDAPDHGALLGAVVDLDVGVLAGDAGDALGLEGQAAGGDVGDAACRSGRSPGEAGVADVLVLGDDGDAGGLDVVGLLAAHEHEHDVEVVDHHVHDDADIDGAEGHGADADDLDEAGRDLACPSSVAFCMARMTGLKRSMCPTMRQAPVFSARSLICGAVRHRRRGASR
jgi:hypothetical protein